MRRRRSRRRSLLQAAVISLTALVAAAAVVRAGRRQAGKDGAAGLPIRGEGTDTRISPFDAASPGHRDGATPAVLTRSAD